MRKFIAVVKKFVAKKETGAALVEYGLLVALIAIACIAATQLLGQEVSSVFDYVKTSLAAAV